MIHLIRLEIDDMIWELHPQQRVIRCFPRTPFQSDMRTYGQCSFEDFVKYAKQRGAKH